MDPEEIVETLAAQNRSILAANPKTDLLTMEEVLGLMNMAALRGFRFGSDSALSMVKSKLLVKYLSETTSEA